MLIIVEPEVRQVDSSSSILLSQDCFGYSRFFLYFHTNLEIICSSSVKNTTGSLIGIALNLQIALGSILIFTILILPIHEHGIFLHQFEWKYKNPWIAKTILRKKNGTGGINLPDKRVPKKNMYLCFIEYAKAFDCVAHNKLWKILKEMGIQSVSCSLLA